MAFSDKVQAKILADMLATRDRTLLSESEAGLSHLSDLARLTVGALPEGVPTLTALKRGFDGLPVSPPPRDALPEHTEALLALRGAHDRFDRASFARLLASHLAQAGRGLTLSDFLPLTEAFETVACASNPYATTAYTELLLDMASPIPCRDYEEAMTALLLGEADAALLPFRGADGTPIRIFGARMAESELYITEVVSVTDRVGTPMDLALCARRLLPQEESPTWLLTLRTADVADTLDALAYLGFTPLTLTGEDPLLLTVSGGADPIPMLLYFTLFPSSVRVAGYYIQPN